jgi:hypothetical protein
MPLKLNVSVCRKVGQYRGPLWHEPTDPFLDRLADDTPKSNPSKAAES